MAVETEEKEETTEEKLAKSSGADADRYAEDLEEQADNMIKEMYKPEGEEAGEAEAEEEEEPAEEKEEKAPEADEILAEDGDTLEIVTEKLKKSEKRVKDNQSAFTKNQQTSKEDKIKSDAVVETLQSTITDLQQKVSERPVVETKTEEKAAEKEIKKDLVNLDKQFEVLNKIDPEIAEPIKQIIESLTSEITGLNGQVSGFKTELKNNADNYKKSAQEVADEKHYGAIDTAHPDNEEITASQEFDDYIETLSPRNKRNARQDLKSGSAENIIEILDDYKESAGITKTEETDETTETTSKDDKLKKAKNMVNPDLKKTKEIKTNSGKVIYTRSMIKQNMHDQAWVKKHQANIDIELAAGRIPDR